jgi:hypothetical protein
MSNRVKNFNQLWCVYAHIIENDLVYIGSGTLQRAYDFMPDKRSENHYKWFSEIVAKNQPFVKIIHTTNLYEEARFIEGRLIAEYKPKFNKNLNKVTFQDLKDAIEKLKNGYSLRKCAREINVAENNLRVLLLSPFREFDVTHIKPLLICN